MTRAVVIGYLAPMRAEHPLIVALVEAFARQARIDPPMLWRALDGLPSDPKLVEGLVSAFYPTVRESDFRVDGLSSVADDATITTPVQTQSTQKEIRGPLPTKHPWSRALRKRGVSIAEWARDKKVSPSSARSWMQEGGGGRAIPRKFVEIIEKEDGIPASAWKNGIVEK